jgi:hypothetical protein
VRIGTARIAALAYGLGLVVVVLLADAGRLYWLLDALGRLPLGDKIFHLGLSLGLAFLSTRALSPPSVRIGRWDLPRAGFVLFPGVALEELSQRWIRWRTFDLGDLAANFLGLALGFWLAMRSTPRTPAVGHDGA